MGLVRLRGPGAGRVPRDDRLAACGRLDWQRDRERRPARERVPGPGGLQLQRWTRHPAPGGLAVGPERIPRLVVRAVGLPDALPRRALDRDRRVLQLRLT